MAGPKKKSAGMPFSFSAGFYNKLVDAVKWIEKNKSKQGSMQMNPDPGQTSLLVANASGSDLPIGSVLQINDRIGEEDTFIFLKAVRGVQPALASRYCVITAEPIPASSVGKCAVAGVCVARVNVTDITHTGANPVIGSYVLSSTSDQGQFRIIEPIANIGVQYLLVAFYAKSERQNQLMIKAPSTGIPGRYQNKLGKATCQVVEQNQDQAAGTADDDYIYLPTFPEEVTVYNWTKSTVCTEGDRYGIAVWVNDNWYIVAEDCADDGGVVSPLSVSGSFGEFANPLNLSVNAMTVASSGVFDKSTNTGIE